MLQSVAVTEVG